MRGAHARPILSLLPPCPPDLCTLHVLSRASPVGLLDDPHHQHQHAVTTTGTTPGAPWSSGTALAINTTGLLNSATSLKMPVGVPSSAEATMAGQQAAECSCGNGASAGSSLHPQLQAPAATRSTAQQDHLPGFQAQGRPPVGAYGGMGRSDGGRRASSASNVDTVVAAAAVGGGSGVSSPVAAGQRAGGSKVPQARQQAARNLKEVGG